MLQFQDVHYIIGSHTILDGASFLVPEGSRAGLIGPNGSGKTTLLRLLVGQISPDSGDIRIRKGTGLGYVAQHPEFPGGSTVFSHVAEPSRSLATLSTKIESIEGQMETEEDPVRLDRLVERHRELLVAFKADGGFEVEGRAEEVLRGLEIGRNLFQREIRSLSGGEKNRVALARILVQMPVALVLDEPTNYLDMEMIEWLEEFLISSSRTVIVSSHDRYFLNRVASSCLELRAGKVFSYRGNYDAFARQRGEEIDSELKQHRKDREELARELEFIRRNFYGQKARQAKSRQKRVDRLESAMKPMPAGADSPPPPRIRFDATVRGGDDVLSVEDVEIGHEGNAILRGVRFQLERGERVALLGPNGCGKTTLLRTLAGEHPPLSGVVHRGTRTVPGRYEQECAAMDSRQSVFEEVHDLVPLWENKRVRDLLAAFLFSGDRVSIPVCDLSGGEKAKVALIRLVLSGSNLLLLDEPTNHLDLHSRAALEEGLLEFPGTILFVSHDRYFIERMADRILFIEGDRVRQMVGSYREYRETLRSRRQTQLEAARRSRQEERERTRLARSRPATAGRVRINQEKLLLEITQLETVLEKCQEEASRPEVYRSSNRSRELSKEMDALKQKIDLLYKQWDGPS